VPSRLGLSSHTPSDGNHGSNRILKNTNTLADSDVPNIRHLPKSTAADELAGRLEGLRLFALRQASALEAIFVDL